MSQASGQPELSNKNSPCTAEILLMYVAYVHILLLSASHAKQQHLPHLKGATKLRQRVMGSICTFQDDTMTLHMWPYLRAP